VGGTGRGAFIDSVPSAVDGFHEVVVQTLRPWAPKAPQLPKSGRSAAETAGIDTTPPRADLDEPAHADLTTGPEAVDVAPGIADAIDGPAAALTPPPAPMLTMVVWDRVSDRLDREHQRAAEQRDGL